MNGQIGNRSMNPLRICGKNLDYGIFKSFTLLNMTRIGRRITYQRLSLNLTKLYNQSTLSKVIMMNINNGWQNEWECWKTFSWYAFLSLLKSKPIILLTLSGWEFVIFRAQYRHNPPCCENQFKRGHRPDQKYIIEFDTMLYFY